MFIKKLKFIWRIGERKSISIFFIVLQSLSMHLQNLYLFSGPCSSIRQIWGIA